MTPIERIAEFAIANGFTKSRGALNVGLVLTRRASADGLPLDPEQQLSPSGGQVRGLSGAAGDAILREHGVTRSIGTEVGRTNRGSIEKMRAYVAFLNKLHESAEIDLGAVESFWVQQFVARFASQPFRIKREAGTSIQKIIHELVAQAEVRQRDSGGAMIAGAMLQHLVGAKLQVALAGKLTVEHHGASVSDAQGRSGDFDLGDAAIHVTAAPGELLLAKCAANIQSGRRPMIVSTARGVAAAEGLADQRGLRERIEFFEIEQFLTTNIQELGLFRATAVTETLREIVSAYNAIIDTCEKDPSLRIDW